jgi:hypothetical protein
MTKIIFNAPGQADNLNPLLLEKWNEEIKEQYESLAESEIAPGVKLGSKYFQLDHSLIQNSISVNSVKWFADPAEPAFCQNADVAQKLSDWGYKGRHHLHNEYCEYVVEYKTDQSGKIRPKRVQITTELMEYWKILAINDPNYFKTLAENVLGHSVSWIELFGGDPSQMTPKERESNFTKTIIGYVKKNPATGKNEWVSPTSKINTDNALFMSHAINGLDDLLYIVMFGAKPYARLVGANYQKVKKESIFKTYGVTQLACRHADPAAAMGAYNAVFEGRQIAFNQNLGMFIHSFAKNNFAYNGNPVPDTWVKFSRGQNNLYQRLVFGPSDNENVFLDDITVEKGGVDVNVKGGFEILQHIEVGPIVQVGQPSLVTPNDYVALTESDDAILCNQADVCSNTINPLWQEYNSGGHFVRVAPRTTEVIV